MTKGDYMDEHSSALVGFAVLRANYNFEAPSYVDNFRGFVLGVLAEQEPSALTQEDVASEIHENFGINIPDLVVGKILKRAVATKFIIRSEAGFVLTKLGNRNAPAIRSMRDKYLRQQNALEDRFRIFIESEFPQHLKMLDAKVPDQLSIYLEKHSVPLIASSAKGKTISRPEPNEQEPGFDFLIACFVAHLYERDDITFGYLEESAKGAILAAVVTLDTSSFNNSLSDLSIYIDTPVLIDLLGYAGPVPLRATQQLVQMAQAQGASLKIFEHSLRELDGVLLSAESYSRNSSQRQARPINLYFQDKGWSAADIALERDAAPESIVALGIEVKAKPGDYHNYGLDEEKLDKSLQNVVHYKYETTRRYDLESLSAIHRLRAGSTRGTLDRCKAVLLTDNTDLARAAQVLEDEQHYWPLAMTDSALAGILWARSPAVAAEIPRRMVVASAYAGMQPESYLWAKYVDEVEILEERGAVSADDAVVLRSTSQGRKALMEETLGDASQVTPDSPLIVLQRLKARFEGPLLEQLETRQLNEDSASKSANAAAEAWIATTDEVGRLTTQLTESQADTKRLEEENNAFRSEKLGRRTIISVNARKKATRFTKISLWVIAFILISFSTLNVIRPPWLTDIHPAFSIALVVATIITTGLVILESLGQGKVVQWVAPLENHLAKYFEKSRLRKEGFD